MPLAVTCPHCSCTIDLPDSEAGRIVRCPECEKAFEAAGMGSVLAGGITLVSMLLYLFALYDMCSIPAQSGVKGLTQAAAWTTLAGFLLLGLGLFLLLVNWLSTPSYGRTSRSDAF